MHLVLGEPYDPLSAGVRDALLARNQATRLIASPIYGPLRFTWQMDAAASRSILTFDDGLELPAEDISGVFVGSVAGPDPRGWERPDLLYMYSEARAAVLAWLWSLDCPVVNRADARNWYQPNPPLMSWRRRLVDAGLPTMDALLTNLPEEARRFARRGATSTVDAVVFGPLTNEASYLVANDQEWSGLASLQRTMPVALTYPHGAAHFACVVGDGVVWDPTAPSESAAYEPRLRAFAADVGLTLVEVGFAAVDGRLAVINVDPRPQLHRFAETSGVRIVEAIADFLTEGSPVRRAEPVAVQ
jgi:hypothetical protein